MGEARKRVLVAEDEAPLLDLIRLSLEANNYQVFTARDGQEALELFDKTSVDLVILDVMMPRLDGFTVCQEIRRRSDVPIMIITALGNTADVVKGLEVGADDYISKPFTFKEVLARVRALLRRAAWAQKEFSSRSMSIGDVSMDVESQEVIVRDVPIHLAPTEFALLRYLMERAGKPVSKRDIFQSVWGTEYVGGTNLVEVAVRRLREKVEKDPSKPQYIQTVRGVGYKFRSREEVEALIQEEARKTRESVEPQASERQDTTEEQQTEAE